MLRVLISLAQLQGGASAGALHAFQALSYYFSCADQAQLPLVFIRSYTIAYIQLSLLLLRSFPPPLCVRQNLLELTLYGV